MNACPPIVTMKVLKELFPHRPKETIWRWNTAGGGGMRLPTPDAINEPQNPAWWLDTILEWGERTGKNTDWDKSVIARLCQ